MTYTPNTYTDFKNSVRVASTGNVNVSSPGASIDGIALAAGNRVLLKDQSTPAQNGTYNWMGAAVPMVRAKDADQSGELTPGAASYVEQGTVNGKKTFTLTTTGAIVVGTTPLVYEELTPNLANSDINDLGDVDTSGVVDGALFRYDSTGSQWNDTTNLLLNDNGQLQLSVTGANGGLLIGGDVQLYRSAAHTLRTDDHFGLNMNPGDTVSQISLLRNAVTGGEIHLGIGGATALDWTLSRTAPNIAALGAGDKLQQNAAPTVNDDLTNKFYVDNAVAAATPDFNQAFRRSWFGVG